jgi:hypothetical protein
MLNIFFSLMITFVSFQSQSQEQNSLEMLVTDINNVIEREIRPIEQAIYPEKEWEQLYMTLGDVVNKAGLKDETHFIESIKAYVDDKDGAEAIRFFLKGVEESGASSAQEVINILYAVLVAERLRTRSTLPIISYLNYVSLNLSSFRSNVVLPETLETKWVTPESTWNIFTHAIKTDNWKMVGISLTGYIPDTSYLGLIEHLPQVYYLKGDLSQLGPNLREARFKIIQPLKLKENFYLLEIYTETKDFAGTIWPVLNQDDQGCRLIGVLNDKDAKKFIEEGLDFRSPSVAGLILGKVFEKVFQQCMDLVIEEHAPQLAIRKLDAAYRAKKDWLSAYHDLHRLKERTEIKLFKKLHGLSFIPDDWNVDKMTILEKWAKKELKQKFDAKKKKNIKKLAEKMKKHKKNEGKRRKEMAALQAEYEQRRGQLKMKIMLKYPPEKYY